MIPLTVSFFTKKDRNTNEKGGVFKAILYGVFIVLVYVALSIPFHLLDSVNPDILNEISTNVWLNSIFFVIFVFFAFSFFGYYELTLPSTWTNSTSRGEGFGGILGVFFMALTLSIVSFSCTGPILGSLLAGSLSADGGAWQLTAGMGGFGIALGLPFALFALFPNMLKALPKSGGWLNTTKVVLGFLELALAFKFLSNADLVKHWGVLKIEVFLGIWILVFAGLTLYIFGKLKFPHDSPVKKLSFFRASSGVLVLAFVLYLGSGFRVNTQTQTFIPLTLLSGLAPPVGYSFLYPNDCPNNFDCFKDLKQGVAYAQKVNKPILIDFTGYACVNCRKMEEHVWPKPAIKSYFENDYVLISLYVDDKQELPEDQKLTVKRFGGGARVLENYGHKWAHFQTQFFQSNSQPYYVLVSPDGKTVLNAPVGYTPDEDEYKAFLECGLEGFNAL
jgi:thiol:disulfide interchange protein DsbD